MRESRGSTLRFISRFLILAHLGAVGDPMVTDQSVIKDWLHGISSSRGSCAKFTAEQDRMAEIWGLTRCSQVTFPGSQKG